MLYRSAFNLVDGDTWAPHSEDFEYFFNYYRKLEPFLLHSVFKPQVGWKYHKDERQLHVRFSLWEHSRAGFILGLSDDDAGQFFIGAYSDNDADGYTLIALLEGQREYISKYFYLRSGTFFFAGLEISYDELSVNNCHLPISESIGNSNLEFAFRRLKVYRDVLTPFFDKLLPQKIV